MHPQQISALIAIDAFVRRRRQLGNIDLTWELSTLAGDASVHRAIHRAVAREGEDNEGLAREEFNARARRYEREAEGDLRNLLDRLSIDANLDRWGSHGELAGVAARIAFVRLYEAGVLTRSTSVVDACASCSTVIDEADTNVVELETEQIQVALPTPSGTIEINTIEPELFVGAVAVAIPTDHPTEEKSVFLPLADTDVVLVKVEGLTEPTVVVPAHDPWSFSIARELGLEVIDVLDSEGVVQRAGDLEGLGRFAARAAATDLLSTRGFVSGKSMVTANIRRCHRCSSIVIPMYGVHWILSFETLIPALLEAIDSTDIVFSPSIAADRLRALAENAASWCVSQQLWAGETIPVYTCLDCGQMTVSVDEVESCGACMGTLKRHADVLDARFVAAIVPLAMLGWPNDIAGPDGDSIILSVGRSGLETWALPIAALGLRLSGRIPFDQLVVHQLAIGAEEIGPQPTTELIKFADDNGVATARAALLFGDLDSQRAHELLAQLGTPTLGEAHIQDLVESYDEALHALDAGSALVDLAAAAREGFDEQSRKELAHLVLPLLAQ